MQKLFLSLLGLAAIIQVFATGTPIEASNGDNLVSIIQRFLKKREDVLPNADDLKYLIDILSNMDEGEQIAESMPRYIRAINDVLLSSRNERRNNPLGATMEKGLKILEVGSNIANDAADMGKQAMNGFGELVPKLS
ncbi:hypothetical protein CHUAL_007029 [Chamberlinius hualienensis]